MWSSLSSLHLLGLQLIKLQFAQVKNVSTKSLDVSLPPFHKGGHNSTFKKFMKNINGFFGMKPSSNSQTLLQVYVHEETFFTTRKRWEKPFLSKKNVGPFHKNCVDRGFCPSGRASELSLR